jgi:outer membrane protein W
VAAWLLLFLVLFRPAARAEQRELQLGLQPVYGITYIDQRSPSGGGGNLQLSYGITDAVAVQLHGGLTAHPVEEDMDKKLPAGLLLTWHASVGVMYALDIVRIVPYFEASLGLLGVTTRTTAGSGTTLNAGAELGLGADYMLNRRWAVGVASTGRSTAPRVRSCWRRVWRCRSSPRACAAPRAFSTRTMSRPPSSHR